MKKVYNPGYKNVKIERLQLPKHVYNNVLASAAYVKQ